MSIEEAIAKVIAKYFPHIIYLDTVGEDFDTPSFFIYPISELNTAYNRWTYNSDLIIQIVYFGARDEYNNIISKSDQENTINKLRHKFMANPSILYDEDSWGKIINTSKGYTGDKDVTLQLKIDTTIGTRQDYDEEHPIPNMGSINVQLD